VLAAVSFDKPVLVLHILQYVYRFYGKRSKPAVSFNHHLLHRRVELQLVRDVFVGHQRHLLVSNNKYIWLIVFLLCVG